MKAQLIHFIGIGGTGLSAIARVLLESGVRVTGSDRQLSPLAQALQQAGVRIMIGHAVENVHGASLVVRSSAIPDDNPEVLEARRLDIPVLKRADYLGQLMSGRIGIAIAGAHGKTTTTAMTAWLLTALRKDPTFIIGGVSTNLGANARAGRGPYFVIEADEYDRMFHGLSPNFAIVTNIEHDHPDCFPTPEDFYQAFVQFTRGIQPGGHLFLCADDPGCRRLLGEMAVAAVDVKVHPYGIDASDAEYRAVALQPNPQGGFSFDVLVHDRSVAHLDLQVPGLHNVLNALAVFALGHVLGLPVDEIASALADFRGTGRRFEVRGDANGITIIDDYGHHPTEIRATLAAARARYPGRSLWAVWQPHTYSRTQTLFDEFTRAFGDADHVLVTEVFASRETAPATEEMAHPAQAIVAAMQASAAAPDVHFIPTLDETAAYLLNHLRPGDVLIVFSAGDADQVSARVLRGLPVKT